METRHKGLDGPFIDIKKARAFIETALEHYKHAPTWFKNWLDIDLYVRLGEDIDAVPLRELLTLQSFSANGCWMAEMVAVNTAYKLFCELGRNTTGFIDY